MTLLIAFWVYWLIVSSIFLEVGRQSCLGFVIASSLDKQELTEHDPILKTITLIIGQTLPVMSFPNPPPNSLKCLVPMYNIILQKLKHAYLYSTGVNHWQYQLLRHRINTQAMKAGYGVNLPVRSSVSITQISKPSKSMLCYLRPHCWEWSNRDRSHASSIPFSALSTRTLKQN